MRHDPDRNRLKLFISSIVLAVVLLVAAIAQFAGKQWLGAQRSAAAGRVAAPVNPQPRAVFGDEPEPARVPAEPEKQPPAEPVPQEPVSRSRTAGEAATTAEIESFLERWRATLVRGDVKAQAILYAPKMEQFFNRRNVTRETVVREKTRFKELYPNVNLYEISDIQVESQRDDAAVVTFRKEWDMHGQRRFSGAERQRLKLRKISGDWKIVSEEETKVYWVKRG